jgi:arylsulfatase A-like enzyme
MPLGRREFLLGGAALSGLSSQFSYATQKKKKTDEPRPNILLIVADSIGSWMLGCGGNTQIQTPNIDLLAKGGTRFAANFAYQPSSSPSRVTLLTGRPQGSPADPMLFDILAGEGYNCGFCGKWDMGETSSPLHHNAFWQPLARLPEPVTAKAKEFLDQQNASKPFFLTVGYGTVLEGHAPKYYEQYPKSGSGHNRA